MVTLNNVGKTFNIDKLKIAALREVSFKVEQGEFFTVIGPSGCGKSTLLRIIANLTKPTTGSVEFSEPPKVSFVFQNYALFPFLTVWENIDFGLKMTGLDISKRKQMVAELIDEMGLLGFEDKHPKELSGGMKQRVGIARSLAVEPNLLLLDEPFSSLDEFTAEKLRQLLLQIWQKRKMTVILVTHLITEALQLSDRICVLSRQPGTVREIMANKLTRPRNLRAQEFFVQEDKLRGLIEV